MLKKEGEILCCFAKEPWRKYTFSELQNVSKKKSKSYLASALKKFVDDGIINREPVGHLPVYCLNAASAKAQVFAGFVLEYDAWNKKRLPYKDLQKAIDKIPTENYVFIVTGSYAQNRQRGDSDIDVAILIDDSSEPKRLYAELSHFCEMNIPQIHLYVFRNREFLEMLLSNEANYGKEIARNNLVLCGGATYIKIVDEAIRRGFKG